MATFNPTKLKAATMDGVQTFLPADAQIIDVVPKDVNAISVVDSSGKTQLLQREQFLRPIPEGFTTHLTHVEKGG